MPQTTITSSIPIAAPPETVWAALIDPVRSPLWRMSVFATDWQPGSPIRITAEIGGRNPDYTAGVPVGGPLPLAGEGDHA